MSAQTRLEKAWADHIDWAVSKQMVYYSMPRTVTSQFVVELLAYLDREPADHCYNYRMAQVLGHDSSNLIRRMRRWEQLGVVTSVLSGRHRLYTLTRRGRRLASLAVKDSAHAN